MTNPVDSAIENAENETTGSNKRGPRAKYYFCAAVRGKKVVHEVIKANSTDEAQEIFQENHELEAQVCEDGSSIEGGGNGFYLAMGTGMSAAQRISVTVTPRQLLQRTTESYLAEFKGWNVVGGGLKACTVKINGQEIEFDDNELVSIEFEDRVNADSKTPKPKLKKREVIRREDLENLRTMSA